MSIESVVARAQASEQLIWRSTCTIERADPNGDTFDPTQGGYEKAQTLPVYMGSCQIRPLRPDRDVEVLFGEGSVGVGSYLVKVPLEPAVRRGDTVTITSSSDPLVVGVVLQVKEATMSEWAPVRRMLCEELFS